MLHSAYVTESCGQSTSHSRILSRYSSWVPRKMGNNGSENVRFKINFMMYNILTN